MRNKNERNGWNKIRTDEIRSTKGIARTRCKGDCTKPVKYHYRDKGMSTSTHTHANSSEMYSLRETK
jgi:hypothetical protein